MKNILLVYPNVNGQAQIQMGLASISAVLKQEGYKVDLFDTTFEAQGSFTEVSEEFMKKFDSILDKFKKKIEEFNPDLLLFGVRSLEFDFTQRLIKGADVKVPVIIGGQHPTVSPEEVIKSDVVDYICVGEGEEALIDLLNAMKDKTDDTNIKNIWAKKDGKIYRNPVRPLMKDLDKLPRPDWELFDPRHVTERGSFETSRGCPYSCTYCVNDYMQKLYGGVGGYHRDRSISKVIEDMEAYVKMFPKVNYIWLIDETFTLRPDRVKEFCEQFKERIGDKHGVVFGCMTRPEALTQEKVDYLKMGGCVEIAMGIESGNEKYRKEMLDRQMPQEAIPKAFLMAKEAGIKTYSFNMLGFPNEKREDIFQTIDLNRRGKVDEIQITIFYPFQGTRLRDFCDENGLLQSDTEKEVASYYEAPIVKNPHMKREEIVGLFRTFVIYCRAPKIFWPIIRLMEFNNPISINMGRVANTFIKQGFKIKTFGILFEHLFKMIRKPITG